MNATLAATYLKTKFTAKATADRFWEIDAVRGVAVVMMVIYHFVYDLYFFQITDVIFTNRFWFYFQRITASTFIMLVGVSLAIIYQRAAVKNRTGRSLAWRLFQRGTRIFGWGMVISLGTYFALGPALYIKFGILHFIGFSIAISYPFLRYSWLNVSVGILLIVAGRMLQQYTFDLPWLVWLGFEPANHAYVDYFPAIAWYGVVLLGIAAGNLLYRADGRVLRLPDLSGWGPVAALRRMGQHSLPIYLLHQPVLFALLIPILWLLGIGNPGF
jgi:uncharacterized membrane protein